MEDSSFSRFITGVGKLQTAVKSLKSVNVNSKNLRAEAKELVQLYFREVDPDLKRNQVGEGILTELSELLQRLNTLASAGNSKASYKTALAQIKAIGIQLEISNAIAEGRAAGPTPAPALINAQELSILNTLDSMVPTAGLSYRQAIADFAQSNRHSYRGVAAEFREVLREVLDHMAPDAEVMKMPGFKLESGQQKPTQRQKARFILSSRGLPKNAQGPALNVMETIEGAIAGLARSLYERGSISAHVGATRQEVANLKRYLDVVLAEFLQLT